jgi:FAD:protein FMN transferase
MKHIDLDTQIADPRARRDSLKAAGTEGRLHLPSRREFLALGVGALVVGALPVAALRHKGSLIRRTLPAMGTIVEIAVVHRDASIAHAAIDDAFAVIRRIESLMTRFRDDSDIGRINRFAGRELVPVSEDTLMVVQSALHWARATGGAFDPSLGRAVELWDVAHRTAPPAATASRHYAGRSLYRSVRLDLNGAQPRIGTDSADAGIDLGGIAKGYAVDMAVDALRAHGIEHGLVNAGGDLYALGNSPEGDGWRVGLRSPSNPATIDRTIVLTNQAVATSGDYLQYFEHGGRRYHHLLDPRTAEPCLIRASSISVISSRCTNADAAATAAFSLDPATAEQTLASVTPIRQLIRIG